MFAVDTTAKINDIKLLFSVCNLQFTTTILGVEVGANADFLDTAVVAVVDAAFLFYFFKHVLFLSHFFCFYATTFSFVFIVCCTWYYENDFNDDDDGGTDDDDAPHGGGYDNCSYIVV